VGLFDKFVQKQVGKHMDIALKHSEELMNADRTDPEAMRALAEKQQAETLASMPKFMQNRLGKMQDMISPEQKERIDKLTDQALQQQAEMYKKLNEK
jgi:hypothetical protein